MPVVYLNRYCDDIEELYSEFESWIPVIADSWNYDLEITGYTWIVTLLLWVSLSGCLVYDIEIQICMNCGVWYWIVQVVAQSSQSVLPFRIRFKVFVGTTFWLRTCWVCWKSIYKITEKCFQLHINCKCVMLFTIHHEKRLKINVSMTQEEKYLHALWQIRCIKPIYFWNFIEKMII